MGGGGEAKALQQSGMQASGLGGGLACEAQWQEQRGPQGQSVCGEMGLVIEQM